MNADIHTASPARLTTAWYATSCAAWPAGAALRAISCGLLAVLLATSPLCAQETVEWFEVGRLNPDLPDVPDSLDRSTPRGALEGFLDAHDVSDTTLAAHFLDVSSLETDQQRLLAPLLARKLGEVIERRVLIDWTDLPDRPDAMLESVTDSDPVAGMPRRSVSIGILDVAGRPVDIRLNRLKPENADAVWVFSRQTVRNIDRLYLRYGPGWFESSLPDAWLEKSYLSLRKWEFVGLPVLIGFAVVVIFVIRWIVSVLADRAPWHMARNAAWAARTPLGLFVAAATLDFATTDVIAFSALITTFLSPLLLAGMVIAVTLAILRAIDTLLDVVTQRYVGEIDDEQSAEDRSFYTSIYAVRRIVVLLAVTLGVGVVMVQLRLFETLGMSLLASAGLVTVLLGIAGQTVLGNILASLQIAIAKPIRIGDSVYYEGDWAYVEAIFYTFIRLRTWDDRRLIVPVKYFVSNPFENWSMEDARMTRTFVLVVDHMADVDALRETFLELASADEDVIEHEDAKALVIDHDHNGMHVRFYAAASDPTAAWNMHARLRESMLSWIRDTHPEWWPRERVIDASHQGTAVRGGSVGDPGG
ncbi:mechanosensitive ion channel family protein [Algihabitans albus]|uniref:mechanosensitive ion channel family protein n=1 Tax=Algihabitans albus TaxID=2164067 RepID=UPI000E5CE1F2|nr:mechanosensitive ion channel domain-containing protein [Algihabitans albus]